MDTPTRLPRAERHNFPQLDDIEPLPAGLPLDPDHPHADPYLQNLHALQRGIVAASAKLSPKKLAAARAYAASPSTYTDIAYEAKVNPSTVSKWIKQDADTRHLIALLRHYKAAIDGPNLAQRSNLLWRIARDNEKIEPRTSIAAIAELNRTDPEVVRITAPANQQQSGAQVVIIMDNNSLPATALDRVVESIPHQPTPPPPPPKTDTNTTDNTTDDAEVIEQ